jgi:hypothetical protein
LYLSAPAAFDRYLAALPAMSLDPPAPFSTKKPVHLRRGLGKATLRAPHAYRFTTQQIF